MSQSMRCLMCLRVLERKRKTFGILSGIKHAIDIYVAKKSCHRGKTSKFMAYCCYIETRSVLDVER